MHRQTDQSDFRIDAATLTDLIAARELTLGVLERLHDGHVSAAHSNAVVAIQEAANRLGVAESALTAPAPAPIPAELPAPILDADDPATVREPMVWSGEASAVLALAEFSVPYATDPSDGAERWLRVLRREGAVGRALADLGYPEVELSDRAEPVGERDTAQVEAVRAKAEMLARHRDGESVTTIDVLFGVLARYGGLVERALYTRGTTRDALLERVSLGAWAPDTLTA